MKSTSLFSSVLFFGSLMLSHQALSACAIDKSPKDLSLDEVSNYYECVKADLAQGYQGGDNAVAKAYPNWKAGATGPAKPGFHSNRYLMTYVNDIGHSAYVAYAPSDVDMPVGSVIAKESFKIKSGGKLKAGPLFIMEKVGVDQAPKAQGWVYSAVKASGKPMSVKQSFCHSCHQAYAAQDALGYPVESVRLK
jgi:hypothetical protein